MKYEDYNRLIEALRLLTVIEEEVNHHDWPNEYSTNILVAVSSINNAKNALVNIIYVDGMEKATSVKTLLESEQNAQALLFSQNKQSL